jgi:hypothetical protein
VHQDVEAAEALLECWPERIEAFALFQIDREKCGGAAQGADFVIGFFKAALGAGDEDEVGAESCEFDRGRPANAPACPGNKCYLMPKRLFQPALSKIPKVFWFFFSKKNALLSSQLISTKRLSCRLLRASMSGSAMG